MKHGLMATAFIFVLSLVIFSQTSIQKEQVHKPEQKILRSPMMGFEVEDNDPFRMLYSGAYAVNGDDKSVELKLEPKNLSGKTVRAFTVYCEEEFDRKKDGNVVREVHRITTNEMQPVFFKVQKDSKLTLWVGSIQFEDGVVWFNK